MPDLDGTPGEIIVHAIDGTLPDSLDGCDQLMQAVDSIGWLAKARICQHVRDTGIYTERFSTFEACCREMWGMSRNYVNKLIAASGIVESLGTNVPTPATESHARPLTKLPADEQADAWEEVVADAEATGEKITAKKVKQVVARRRGSSKQTDSGSKRLPPFQPAKDMVVYVGIDTTNLDKAAGLLWQRLDHEAFAELARNMTKLIQKGGQ